MTDQRTGFLGRYGRFLWGGAALLLLLVLIASVFLSGSSVDGAERDAAARAESLSASVVEDQLTADLLTRDIAGTAYRDLTVRVQAGILSDDRFTVVRIWRFDGALIYSTAQKDDTSVVAGDDQWIQQALDGQTVSVLSSTGTYHDGLKRPNEELLQTFVPIRLSSDSQVDGVVEIDQRYSAIHNEAFKVWRPLQLVVLLLLVAVAALFVRWVRNAPLAQDPGPPPERRLGPGRRADDLNVADAVARADRAERLARESEKRLRELEAVVAAAPSTATATAALEELDLKLRASEAEREELAGTVRRLQGALSEKEAELALAREGSAGTRADTKRVNKLIAEAEGRVAAAEKKAAAAEKKSQEAAKRATVTAERALEMEAQLREAEQKAAAEKLASTVGERGAGTEEKIAEAERRALEAEQRAADAEDRALRAETTAADAEQRALQVERKAADEAQLVVQAERRAADAEALAAKIETRAAEAEERAAQAERKAIGPFGDSEPGRDKRRDPSDKKVAAALKQAEGERDQLVTRLRDLERLVAEAQAKTEASERELAVKNLQLNASAEATAGAQALEERAVTAEVRLADSQERFTDAQSRLADTETKLAVALARLDELEQAEASRAGGSGDEVTAASLGSGPNRALEARIAELENARRADVVELQRAQESFANTQVELSNATRKLREAEARVRELELAGRSQPARTVDEPDAEPAPVPSYVTASDPLAAEGPDDDVPSLGAFGDGGSPHAWETASADPESEAEEPEAEGLSLRERLARAAAARRRLS